MFSVDWIFVFVYHIHRSTFFITCHNSTTSLDLWWVIWGFGLFNFFEYMHVNIHWLRVFFVYLYQSLDYHFLSVILALSRGIVLDGNLLKGWHSKSATILSCIDLKLGPWFLRRIYILFPKLVIVGLHLCMSWFRLKPHKDKSFLLCVALLQFS